MIEYKTSEVKDMAAHLRTLGAYVQQPNPKIVGLDKFQAMGSQDAKSLYPTIVVLLNIGYDTFRGRIYEMKNIGKIYNFIKKAKSFKKPDKHAAISNIRTALYNAAKEYAARESVSVSAESFKNFTRDYYGDMFRKLIESKYTMEEITHPTKEEHYYLLKSILFPLLEAVNWLSIYNRGYSKVCTEWVFNNQNFEEQYKDEKFLVLHNINSTKSLFDEVDCNGLKEYFKDYLITPYGTYFEKHDIKTSFECPLILNGMNDRAYVKNQMLVEGVIVGGWDKLTQEQQAKLLIDGTVLSDEETREIIDVVGDPDDKKRDWQFSVLKEIVFNTLVEHHELKDKLEVEVAQKNSKSNSIKVTLNSGYGLNGLLSWAYGNNLIANSITNGGKIYGIKLFQQIASNKLKKEEITAKIKRAQNGSK